MTAPETPAERRARLLAEAADQAMFAARKLSAMIAITDNPQDVITYSRDLARAHRDLRQTLLLEERFEREPAPHPMAPTVRDHEIRLRRARMQDALRVRLEREVPEKEERAELEREAEAWFATEIIDEAFVNDPGAAVMARLTTHLGLQACPPEPDDPPRGVVPLRPNRQSSA